MAVVPTNPAAVDHVGSGSIVPAADNVVLAPGPLATMMSNEALAVNGTAVAFVVKVN